MASGITDIVTDAQTVEKPWLFKKGNSGNLKGRPKKTVCITSLLRDELKKVPPILGKDSHGNIVSNDKKQTWQQLFAEALPKVAYHQLLTKGNTQPLEFIVERLEGKAVQPITGKDGGPLIAQQMVFQVIDPQTASLVRQLQTQGRLEVGTTEVLDNGKNRS